jgi:DNA (cytosine-5)-methyltransferase 1
MKASGRAPRPRPIHESIVRLGEQDSKPRFFASGRYLVRAKMAPDTWIELLPGPRSLVIRSAAEPTGKRVNIRKRTGLPVIDLNCATLARLFRPGDALRVVVEEGRITLFPAPTEASRRARPRNGKLGGVFAGAGFLDEAFRQAGYSPAWAIEIDEAASAVYAENHPGAATLNMSVYEALHLDLEPVECMVIGLPCTPFSKVRTTLDNRGTKVGELPKTAHADAGHLAAATAVLIARVNPSTVVLENVDTFQRSETAHLLSGFLGALGYYVETRSLDSAKFGGMTRRVRTVMIAQTPDQRGWVRDPWPEPRASGRPIRDVLDREVPDGAWFTLADGFGRRLREREERNRALGRGFKMKICRESDTAVGTFSAQYGAGNRLDVSVLQHPRDPSRLRYFTVREGVRLHGAPEAYVLPEGRVFPWRLIGQGVHVGLFRQVAERLRAGPWKRVAEPTRGPTAGPMAMLAGLTLFQAS